MRTTTHFVLDQNFPWYVTSFAWPSTLRVTRLSDVAPDFVSGVEDWQVILELARTGDVDGYITNDSSMLEQAEEMVALGRTHLALVVTRGVGHQPLRATGLVMVHLDEIARRMAGRPSISVLQPANVRTLRI